MNLLWPAKAEQTEQPALDRTTSAEAQTWKQMAGRNEGDDGYEFFDMSRALGQRFLGKSRSESFAPLVETQTSPEEMIGVKSFIGSLASDASRTSTAAEDQCEAGIKELTQGFDRICQAGGIRHGNEELEALGQAIIEVKERIEEAALWKRRCEGHGELLSVQLCSAAGDEEPPDWSMGLLFISTEGFYFESNETPPWGIGPMKFADVTRVEKIEKHHLASCDIRLEVKNGSVHLLSGIRDLKQLLDQGNLTLSPPRVEEKVADAVVISAAVPEIAPGSDPGRVGKDADDSLEDWMDQWADGPAVAAAKSSLAAGEATDRASSKKTTSKSIRLRASYASAGVPSSYGSAVRLGKSKNTLNPSDFAPRTETFFVAADQLPLAEAPKKDVPIFQTDIPKLSIDRISELLSLDKDWPVQKACWTSITEVKSTPWATSRRVGGTKMRRFQFRMPLPPAPMCPSSSSMTVLCRLGGSSDRVVLVQEACTHEVPYGENFLVQDVSVFSSIASGGVSYEKYTSVRWVSNLPFVARWMKPIIESQSKGGSKEAAEKFAVYLREVS